MGAGSRLRVPRAETPTRPSSLIYLYVILTCIVTLTLYMYATTVHGRAQPCTVRRVLTSPEFSLYTDTVVCTVENTNAKQIHRCMYALKAHSC
jgi:hypothetical protein